MKKTTELQEMTKHIVNGMKEHGVERIIYTASGGVHGELTGLMGKLMMLLLKNALVDHRAVVNYITEAKLTYTIVRLIGLTNNEQTGNYRESNQGVPEKRMSISREIKLF